MNSRVARPVVVSLTTRPAVPVSLVAAMALAVVGLVPFALFTGVLYVEHKRTLG